MHKKSLGVVHLASIIAAPVFLLLTVYHREGVLTTLEQKHERKENSNRKHNIHIESSGKKLNERKLLSTDKYIQN